MKLFIITFLFALFSCGISTGEKTADYQAAQETKKMGQEAWAQVGMPNIKNFREMKLMRQIYELCDREDLICYAYLYNRNEGTVGQFLGKCIGYGIPYSVQFSNPQRIVEGDKELGYDFAGVRDYMMILPQAEPNGLFKPEGLSATWLTMLDKDNKPRMVYVEPEIIVSPFPLK